jgi:hypothetical protein
LKFVSLKILALRRLLGGRLYASGFSLRSW